MRSDMNGINPDYSSNLTFYPQIDPSMVWGTTHGSSQNPDFSLALHTPDPDIHRIIQNRRQLAQALMTEPNRITCLQQTHSANVRIITDNEIGRGAFSHSNGIPDTDAMILTEPGTAGLIFTADCVPILLYDKNTGTGALIHAGWKGTAAAITQQTIRRMILSRGTDPKEIQAVIAPAIGRCCYQISEELKTLFSLCGHSTEKLFFNGPQKLMLDLKEANRIQLLNSGVPDSQIAVSRECTCCDKNLYSYRRQGEKAGRQAAFLVLK